MADYEFPDNCLYTEGDEWVRSEGDVLRIGITDYAQQELGDVVFLELPESEQTLQQGDTFGVIESVKAVSDLLAPVSGEVVKSNLLLEDNPELVNESCYQEAWILDILPSDRKELESLMDEEAYQAYVEERAASGRSWKSAA